MEQTARIGSRLAMRSLRSRGYNLRHVVVVGVGDLAERVLTTMIGQTALGMRAMAQVPHVYVKLSMLGYAVPGWMDSEFPARRKLVKQLVTEVLEWFGPNRCMAALNWWKDAATSDSDGMSAIGPSPMDYVEFIAECLEAYSVTDKERVFSGTAREFYRLSS